MKTKEAGPTQPREPTRATTRRRVPFVLLAGIFALYANYVSFHLATEIHADGRHEGMHTGGGTTVSPPEYTSDATPPCCTEDDAPHVALDHVLDVVRDRDSLCVSFHLPRSVALADFIDPCMRGEMPSLECEKPSRVCLHLRPSPRAPPRA